MDGSGLAGNPSAASSSGTLPVDTLQPSDWISAPEGTGRRSQEPGALPVSQDQQSFPGNLHNPSEGLQEPAENFRLPSGNHQGPDKSRQEPVENIHLGLETDQKPPENLQSPTGEPEEEPHVPVRPDPPPEEPEPGGSPPPSGPTLTSQEPSMSEDQNVEAPAPPTGPGSHDPPGDPPQLQLSVGSPELDPPADPAELHPLELHPPGDPPELCPPGGSPEPHLPGDPPPPTGSDHQNRSEVPSPSPQQAPPPAASPSGEPRLCGFLLKLGGPLKTWKLRWFCYEEQRNQLLYYRGPQDQTPLGRVGLSGATFRPLLEPHSSSSFNIHTPQRTFTLKALDQELMFYWLQQLQLKRWQHRQSTSGGPDEQADHDDFLPVRTPVGLVGQQAANSATQRAPLANLSLKHPLIELQNLVHSLLRRTSSSSSFSQDLSRSVFHVESPPPWTPPTAAHSAPAGSQGEEQEVQNPTIHPSSRRRSETSPPLLSVGRRRKKSSGKLLSPHGGSALFPSSSSTSSTSSTSSSSSTTSLRFRLQQDDILTEELKAQKEVQELQKEVERLREKNRARQEVIVKLSDQLTSCMANQEAASCSALKQLQQEVENLRDDLKAHQNQNRFLNSEIFQLTRLWRSSSEQEKNLMVKCAHLEVRSCHVERSYLDVLQPLLEAQNLQPEQREALKQLVEQSQQRELQSSARVQETRDQYDQYGFKLVPDYELGDLRLLARIQAQELQEIQAQQIQAQHIQTLEILSQEEALQRLRLERWAQYLAGRPDQDLGTGPELKALLRAGIPPKYRARVWRWMVRTRTRTVGELCRQSYQQLCQKIQTAPLPASRQIDLDLHRTLTANQHFSSPSSPAHQQLRRILLAFSWRNPAIGYCQGLNRLAAVALLVLQEEQEAFWCLVAVVEAILPQDYYTSNLVASQADQRVLKDLVEEKLPRLAAHLVQHGVDVTLVTFHWFLVVFVENLPGHVLLPLWDAFLYEGSKVVFRYALALLKYKEAELLRLHDASDLYHFLRFFPRTVTDSRRLASLAFRDMNPFPGRLLRSRRALHLQRLQGELKELEQQQQRDLVVERAERRDKELGAAGGASEDDDL